MSSIPRHHAEWLSLMEISGPFLSMPVLLDAFPQGLDARDPDHGRLLRAAYEEWADNQGGLAPDPAIHRAWIRFVLTQTLALPDETLAEGQAIPESVKATLAEHGETVRPDMMVVDPDTRQPQLLIAIYPAGQDLGKVVPGRNWKASPATRMMELLHSAEIRLGLATNGEQWLLVQAKRGETTGFASWYAGLWLEEPLTLRAFRTLLGVARFFGVPDEQTLPALLDASAQDQHEVTDQLGYQVRRAVEILVQAIDLADQDRGRTLLTDVDEERLYEAALTVMMRLVFLLSAEERGLLLLGDPLYDQNYAVSTLRAQLRRQADRHGEEVLERGYDAWSRLLAAFRAVYGGVQHEDLHLPAYGGSLFDPDRFPFLEGRRGSNQYSVFSDQYSVAESLPTEQRQPNTENWQLNTENRQPNTENRQLNTENRQPNTENWQLNTENWQLNTDPPLPINNRTVLHLLEALQILRVKAPGGGSAEARRLSFRALDIEQIGHVYEGLLDHQAVRAVEPVLGLAGTKRREPEIPLAQLEKYLTQRREGAKENEKLGVLASLREPFWKFLKEQTGRSLNALKNSLAAEPDNRQKERLRTACGNDDALYRRVLPFAGLIRNDDYGWPVVIRSGSVYVTAGAARRATGTHYTPRSLTEPIVQHTLEPLVYIGPAGGWPREKWQLRSPAELLALKLCDMSMGSDAFLVQADRYLAQRLVEAWENVSVQFSVNNVQSDSPTENCTLKTENLQITPEGRPAAGDPGETIIPDNDEERLALARRLVADRCLYGVDKNHLAVEMAKLSLWLITLDKNRPFTFLDHALKHGDSLIGADEEMFLRWAHSLGDSSMPLFDQENRRLLAEAQAKRQALQAFTVRDVRNAVEKERLLAEAEAATARIKLGCDLLVGARLLPGLKPKEQDTLLANGLLDYAAGRDWQDPNARRAAAAAQALPAFHWPFEFPEVFAQGGFSALMGNPPFIGGQRIRRVLGDNYKHALDQLYPAVSGSADVSTLFFLRSFANLGIGGVFGLIATNTIAQGSTRLSGLAEITSQIGTIFRATNNQPWPGQAAVVVNIVHVAKGKYKHPFFLDNTPVEYISSFLDNKDRFQMTPFILAANENRSYNGVYVNGSGFILSIEEAREFIHQNNRNNEVLFPYLNGKDLNSNYDQSASRWVINFHDWPLPKAESYIGPMEIVKKRVYPVRQKNKNKALREKWWQFARRREGLYKTIEKEQLEQVLVKTQISNTWAFCFVPPDIIYDQKLVVFLTEQFADFAELQSEIHKVWADRFAATLKQDMTYTPRDVFQTFPFSFSSKNSTNLTNIGFSYHEYRRKLMTYRQEGLTKTYNRFHNPQETAQDIARLRQLHVEMDNAVAAAYGWQDLDLGHGFHETPQGIRYTVSEPARRELLTRLLQLNHQRYEEEVKLGLHEKKKGSRKGAKTQRKKKPKKNEGQLPLL